VPERAHRGIGTGWALILRPRCQGDDRAAAYKAMGAVMPIKQYLTENAFGPDEIEVMSRALEEACNVLGVDGDARVREIIAARIIELASRGERNPQVLRDLMSEGQTLQYRIYPVNREGRILGPSTVVLCAADDEALQQAERASEAHDVEVWQATRFIARLHHHEVIDPK